MEIESVLVEEQLHEVGYMSPTLPKEIFTGKNDNKQGSNTKRRQTEILKNSKP